jgi:hypothetical protein
MDPDADPDPAISVSDLEDSTKSLLLITLLKTAVINVFLLCIFA